MANSLWDVWPEATISECAWHAEKALRDYLAAHNQWPLADDHTSLNYRDWNAERGWHIDLDTEWIRRRNKLNEKAVRMKVQIWLLATSPLVPNSHCFGGL